MKQGQAEPATLPTAVAGAPPAIELRHLRYFVALADAGSFTDAAERMFIAQPTLSQQIRRLEEIVGTQLLQRRREGLQLTKAGAVLLDASRTVLSLVDHEVNRTRQVAGLGRPRLRVVVPPRLPDAFAVEAASALRSAAAAADVDLVWMEAPLDAGFSLIRQRRADAGLGWLTASPEALPAPLDAMSLGEFEPDVWMPAPHAAARRGTISLDELTRVDVIHGPRRAEPGTYDACGSGRLAAAWTPLAGDPSLGQPYIAAVGLALGLARIVAANNLEGVGTYEGTDEVHILIMGRAIIGIPAFS